MGTASPPGRSDSEGAAKCREPFRAWLVGGLEWRIRNLKDRIHQRTRLLIKATHKRWLLFRHGKVIESGGARIVVDSPLVTPLHVQHLLSGRYELAEMEMTRRFIDPSLPTIELGGSIGVLATLANRLLDHPENHVVVEANPLVAPILRKNRDLNGGKFEIVEAAVAYGSPTIKFTIGRDCMTGSTKYDGARVVEVPTTTLRQLIDSRGFGMVNLIVDIEGAEFDLARHELDALKNHVKVFIVETHEYLLKDGSTGRMLQSLESAGFRIAQSNQSGASVFTLVNDALRPASV